MTTGTHGLLRRTIFKLERLKCGERRLCALLLWFTYPSKSIQWTKYPFLKKKCLEKGREREYNKILAPSVFRQKGGMVCAFYFTDSALRFPILLWNWREGRECRAPWHTENLNEHWFSQRNVGCLPSPVIWGLIKKHYFWNCLQKCVL